MTSKVFFFNDTATTEIYTLSLHDALPIYGSGHRGRRGRSGDRRCPGARPRAAAGTHPGGSDGDYRGDPRHCRQRSEEHTSELQSQSNLVCRLLLEKKKIKQNTRLLSICTL